MGAYDSLFEPLRLKKLEIRNRFLSTSHCPAYAKDGSITDRYIRYHEEKARGGVGLTQLGGATTVGAENSSYYGQVNGSTDAVIPRFRDMAAAIHAHRAACMVQLTHGGRRERWDISAWLPTFSPSCLRETIHHAFPATIEDHDMRRMREDFAAAARRVRDGDIDGVEISCQAGTLIEQFWSPAMNHRSDAYGGSLANRTRFGLEVLEAVRAAVGEDFPVGVRMPGDEMLPGGLAADECVEIARRLAASGLIDFISVVGGHATDYQGEARIWPSMWVPSAGYLKLAKAVKDEVSIPIFHATRITDAATAAHAVEGGYLDMVGMTRALIADPHYVRKLAAGREAEIRPCVGVGYCVDRVITGLDACCAHNVATGREQLVPQQIEPSAGPRKRVVVVGAGPGGLEAARVCARRGHEVVLLEATAELGGQVILAAKATWRRDLAGFVTWLGEEIARLGVDIRCNALASAGEVRAEAPDVVVIATGGLPNVGRFEGQDLVATSWDVLAGTVGVGKSVLLVDEGGSHAGLSCAEFLAANGAAVRFVTPDPTVGRELGGTNLGAHMTELHKRKVCIETDARLVRVARAGNRLEAVVGSTYTGEERRYGVDQVVGECGTLPNEDLYLELKPLSRNLGEIDLRALAAFAPQRIDTHPRGEFFLYRIGDAWASRNIHAATLDAMRICKDL